MKKLSSRTNVIQLRKKCHCEPVITPAWEPSKQKEIATPACALVRNDMVYRHCEESLFSLGENRDLVYSGVNISNICEKKEFLQLQFAGFSDSWQHIYVSTALNIRFIDNSPYRMVVLRVTAPAE